MNFLKSCPATIFFCLCVLAGSSFAQQNSYRFTVEAVDDHIILKIRTAEPLPCVGTTIRNKLQWDKDTTVIIMSGFVQPVPCLQGLEPASAQIVLKQGSKTPFYLKFREDSYGDLWKIFVTPDSVHAEPIHRSFTSYSK